MDQYLLGAFFFVMNALVQIYVFAILLRFIAQAAQADFYNPITQAIVTITNPVLAPLRKILVLPGRQQLDYASLVAGTLFNMLLICLHTIEARQTIMPFGMLLRDASFGLLGSILDIYFFAFLLLVIISWVAPASAHPGARLLYQITEPVLAPIRRFIPPVGGLDFSVLVAILIISVLRRFIVPGLSAALF